MTGGNPARTMPATSGALNGALARYTEAGCASLMAISAEMVRVAATPVLAAEREGQIVTLEDVHARRLAVAAGAVAWTLASVPAPVPAVVFDEARDFARLIVPLLQTAAILRHDSTHPWSLGSQTTLPQLVQAPLRELETQLAGRAPSREHVQREVDRHQRALLQAAGELAPLLGEWRPDQAQAAEVAGLAKAASVNFAALAHDLLAQDEILEHWTLPAPDDQPTPAQVAAARAVLEIGPDGSLGEAVAAFPAAIQDVLDDLPGAVQRSQGGPRSRWLGVSGALDLLARAPDVSFGRAAAEPQTLTAPTRIADARAPEQIGRYRLGAELGRGGMATVYRANDETLDRPVALKVAHVALLADARLRFADEVRIAAQLQHPGLVPVYDAGTDAGRAWLAMRLIEGPTLAALQRPVAVERALAFFSTLAQTLDYVHAREVVHRDVKPSNVLVQDAGGDHELALLADFGIARESADERRTVTGQVIGTPGWVAPEVAAGGPATAASDIWALARLLISLLSGESSGDHIEALAVVLGARRYALLAAAIDRDPAARPACAGELRAEMM